MALKLVVAKRAGVSSKSIKLIFNKFKRNSTFQAGLLHIQDKSGQFETFENLRMTGQLKFF